MAISAEGRRPAGRPAPRRPARPHRRRQPVPTALDLDADPVAVDDRARRRPAARPAGARRARAAGCRARSTAGSWPSGPSSASRSRWPVPAPWRDGWWPRPARRWPARRVRSPTSSPPRRGAGGRRPALPMPGRAPASLRARPPRSTTVRSPSTRAPTQPRSAVSCGRCPGIGRGPSPTCPAGPRRPRRLPPHRPRCPTGPGRPAGPDDPAGAGPGRAVASVARLRHGPPLGHADRDRQGRPDRSTPRARREKDAA